MSSAHASWSDRLRALDHASVRLADKTAALNQLLRDLQQGNHIAASHAASAVGQPQQQQQPPLQSLHGSPYRPASQRSLPQTPLQSFRSPPSAPVAVASSAANASAQIGRLHQWLGHLDHSLADASAPPSFAALDALARMHALALAHPLPAIAVPSQSAAAAAVSSPQQPSPAASPRVVPPMQTPPAQPRHVVTPAPITVAAASSASSSLAASPAPLPLHPSPIPSAAAPSSAAAAPSSAAAAPSSSPSSSVTSPSGTASKRSALITIKPLQSASQPGVAQPVMHGVAIPPGTAFVNGRWIRTSPPPHLAESDVYEQSEDEDPFADFSDQDEPAPTTPRNGHNHATTVEQSPPPSHSFSGRKPGKLSHGGATLRRRAEGDVEIGEEDVQELDERVTDGRLAAGAGARRASLVTLSPSVVLEDGQWQTRAAVDGDSTGDADEEEEDDVFADIPDLDVDPEEEAQRRAAELARAGAAAAAKQASLRAAALSRKTTTLRKDLSKHMGQDAEIDEADLGIFDESDAEERNAQPDDGAAAADADADGDAVDADFEADMSQALESPRASRLFAPDLRAPKSAPGVTALTTRREGQAKEDEQWGDVSLLPSHLRHASHSASALEDRPDDLDDLDEEDDQPLPLAASPQARERSVHAKGLSSDLSAPATPSSSWRRGAALSDDDLSDLDASRFGLPSASGSGFASRSASRMSLHSHSLSMASHHSHSHSNHGQLSAALSDDEHELLDDMLDEDEERQIDVKIDVNNKANKDRAARQLHEFDLTPALMESFQEAEQHRARFMGHVRLEQLAVLKRPVDESWLLSLTKTLPQSGPTPLPSDNDVPPLPVDESAAVPAADQAPSAVTPVKSKRAAPETPTSAASFSASGSANGSNRKKKNKKSKHNNL